MKKILWASDYFEVGNAFGYSFHNRKMKEQIAKRFELSQDAEIAVTIQPADKFKPVPGKYNVLFSMFEASELPETYLRGIDLADEIVVPCRFSRDLFRKYTDKKISVCYEGVDPEFYQYRPRSFARGRQKFRILWVGAPNPRKGYPVMIELARVLEKYPEIEIYLKTTVPKIDYDAAKDKAGSKILGLENVMEQERLTKIAMGEVKSLHGLLEKFGDNENIIFDSRTLTPEELLDLYYSAHCFVFPSVGEGWGLTLTEAMATGLPCVSPVHTAMVDYFDDSVGYSVPWEAKKSQLKNYDLEADCFIPSAQGTLDAILQIHNDYKTAAVKGRKASDRMRLKFTWDRAGERLAQILDEIQIGVLNG